MLSTILFFLFQHIFTPAIHNIATFEPHFWATGPLALSFCVSKRASANTSSSKIWKQIHYYPNTVLCFSNIR